MGVSKWKSNCAACQLMRKDHNFKQRMYTSTYFDKQGKETLRQVAIDYSAYLSMQSIYNHARKHGTWYFRKHSDRDETIKEFHEREQIKKDALTKLKKVAPELVPEVIDGQLVAAEPKDDDDWESGLDELIKIGTSDLKKGHMKINASQYVTALKIKADREASKGNQKSDMLIAFAAMASGNAKQA